MFSFLQSWFKSDNGSNNRGNNAADNKVSNKRYYYAASSNRLNSDWVLKVISADSALQRDLKTLRSRSRDLCMNNDYARRFLKRSSSNIVGASGIKLQVKSQEEAIKENAPKTPKENLKQKYYSKKSKNNPELSNHIAEQFLAWSRTNNCSVCGKLSWVDAQRLFIETVARDGEVLVRMVKGYPNEFGFALQFIEADYLDEDLNKSLNDNCYVKMGVEFDRWQKPLAYHLLKKHPGDTNSLLRLHEDKYERINASEIIHGFIVERPGQSRGVPWMQSAMMRLKMLGAYEEAELVAARVSSAKMGFFTSPDGAGYTGRDDGSGNLIMEADPGSFEQLPSGMDFKTFDPVHPNNCFSDFEKAILRGIASGLDISYNTLANDLEGVNFSSIRHASLEDRDSWRMLQNWLIEHFCQPVFEQWLLMAITTKKVKISMKEYEEYRYPLWRPRGWAWIDPLKENHANQIALAQKIKSRSQIAAEQGVDVEELFAQLALEEELAKKYGIDLEKIDKQEEKGNNYHLGGSKFDGDNDSANKENI